MPTKDQLINALRQADAAGDEVAARRFAELIKSGSYEASGAHPSQQGTAQAQIQAVPQLSRQEQIFNELIGSGVNPNVARMESERMALEDPQGRIKGQAETAGLMLTSMASEPIAGISGLASAPFVGGERAGQAVRDVRASLTPSLSDSGKAEAVKLAETLSPVTDVLEKVEQATGGKTFEATGSPALASAATTVPTALMELLGLAQVRGGLKGVEKVRDIANAVPDERVSSILAASKSANVPVLTSDIFPPESFMARSFQSFSEMLGPLGTGTARTSQQRARIEAVEALAEGIDIDTPFAESVVKSLNAKSAKRLESAGRVRDKAITKLDEFGDFQAPKAISKIDEILAKQDRLGATANNQLTNELNAFKQELSGVSDFSLKKDIRTQLIKKVKAFGRAEDTAPAADLQEVKSALDKDLTDFARSNDKSALKDWLSSNREFADELTKTKETEIKRILQSGDATPEKVMPILRGGKPSELNRLYDSLGEKGRVAARSALIQQALKDSKFFEVDLDANPDALANSLNKTNFQQAANVFFRGADKKELDGITRLLDKTRRAQEGQFSPRTGERLLLPGAGTGLGIGVGTGALPLEPTVAALTLASSLIKAYESKPVRNLLIRLANTKKGTKLETQTLDALMTAVVAESQAAKSRQEQK